MVGVLSFIKLALGKEREVIAKLEKIEAVKVVYFISGEYDLVVKLEAPSTEILSKVFIEQIDPIEGIVSSNSHLIIQRWVCHSTDTDPISSPKEIKK